MEPQAQPGRNKEDTIVILERGKIKFPSRT